VSYRVGLRFLGKLLVKILSYIAYNPTLPIPYTLRVYIIGALWRIATTYTLSPKDSYRTVIKDRIVRELAEAVSGTDEYATEITSRAVSEHPETVTLSDAYPIVTKGSVVRELEETSGVADAYVADIADRAVRELEESSSVADAYTANIADIVVRELEESSAVGDAYIADVVGRAVSEHPETVAVAEQHPIVIKSRVQNRPYETVRCTDAIQFTTKRLVARRLEETVKVSYAPVPERPWPEDPTKLMRQYYFFEEATAEELSDFYRMNPSLIQTLDATDTRFGATLNGELYGEEWEERGFEWGTTPGHYTEEWTEKGIFGSGKFSYRVSHLIPDKTYYFRAKARKGSKWWYGEEKSFTVKAEIEIESIIVSKSLSTLATTGTSVEIDSEIVNTPSLSTLATTGTSVESVEIDSEIVNTPSLSTLATTGTSVEIESIIVSKTLSIT